MASSGVESELSAEVSQAAHSVATELDEPDSIEKRFKPGFMSMGEEDELEQAEDDVWENDDISSLAHGELEQHRELREYARITAWEMPLLSSKLPRAMVRYQSRIKLTLNYRTSQTLRTTPRRCPPPLPLHNLHGRNPPRV